MRLNDAGVAAELLGDRTRAVAAFTQALDATRCGIIERPITLLR